MPFWTPKEMWKGKDCFIIGGGKSLDGFDFSVLTDELAIGCNDAFLHGEDICNICIFGDFDWFDHHQSELQYFENPVFTVNRDVKAKWVWLMKKYKFGFHKDGLGWNGNTGSLAMNLALILGAKNIYLLGFDMKLTDGEANWHPNNVCKPRPDVYERFKRSFAITKSEDWTKTFPDRSIINVSDVSELETFPKINFTEFWKERLKDVA